MKLRPAHGVFTIVLLLPLLKTVGFSFAPRLALVDFAIAALALATLARLRSRGAAKFAEIRIPKQLVAGLVLFIASACASAPNAESPRSMFVEMSAYAMNLVLFTLVVLHLRTREDLLRALEVWELATIGVVAVGLVGVVLLVRGIYDSPLTDRPLLTATFERSGQLASYLVASLPILWFQRTRPSRTLAGRLGRFGLLGATLIVLAATASRSGFALGVAVIVALEGHHLFGRRALIGAALAAGLVFLVIAARSSDVPFAFRRASSILRPSSASLERLSPSRHYQWMAFQGAVTGPHVLGIGPGDFQHRVAAYAPAAFRPHEMHNTFLGVWAESGLAALLGLALFTGAMLVIGIESIREAPNSAMRGTAIALLASFVSLGAFGLFAFGLRMRYLWAIQGLLLSAWNVIRWDERSRS